MQTQWIYSSTFLPYTGEPIEFLLEEREQPIHGTFANGIFHSRWADYDADRVASWRESQPDPSAEPIPPDQTAKPGAFVATFKRLGKVFSGSNAAAIEPPRRHSRRSAAASCPINSPPMAT